MFYCDRCQQQREFVISIWDGFECAVCLDDPSIPASEFAHPYWE